MDRIASSVRPLKLGKTMREIDVEPGKIVGTVPHTSETLTVTEPDRPAQDRQTYNYGHCAAWHVHGANAEYRRTQALERMISARATQLSQAAWALSEGLRYVRQAETKKEYEAATAALKGLREKHDLLGMDSTYNTANMPSNPAEPDDYKYGENI